MFLILLIQAVTGRFDSVTILVTGGAGFIGSNFIIDWIENEASNIVNFDKLTYAGNPENLKSVCDDKRYKFIKGDILDQALVKRVLAEEQPTAVVHFAAESHVDRSIVDPEGFLQTNIMGTFRLLEAVKDYLSDKEQSLAEKFRFIHVSTDEVFGSRATTDKPAKEEQAYEPNSPYAASKAASDHIVRAYRQTFGLPIITTNCSNNYGPYQFPEKLIPLMIINALRGERLPVYGEGTNIRDWLFVGDHCSALRLVLKKGSLGETYNIGAANEQKNIDVVFGICDILDDLDGLLATGSRRNLVSFVKDRPGHDLRYAIDASKMFALGWRPVESFETGLRRTILWYLDNLDWVESIRSGEYKEWIERHYGDVS